MRHEGRNIDKIEGTTNIDESSNEKFSIIKGAVNINNTILTIRHKKLPRYPTCTHGCVIIPLTGS